MFLFLPKKNHWDFDRDCADSADRSGGMDTLTLLNSPTRERGTAAHSFMSSSVFSAMSRRFHCMSYLPPWSIPKYFTVLDAVVNRLFS